MTPDLSLLLVFYASDGSACRIDSDGSANLPPETARLAAQIAHLSGEERRMLAMGAEVREVALALGQQRFEIWERENPEAVASCRAAVGRGVKDGLLPAAPRTRIHDEQGTVLRMT